MWERPGAPFGATPGRTRKCHPYYRAGSPVAGILPGIPGRGDLFLAAGSPFDPRAICEDRSTPLAWTTRRISDGWGCASSLCSVLQLLGRAPEFRVHGVAVRELLVAWTVLELT